MDSLWKKNNESTLKYAGDSAKESVNKGLLDAKDYMKDADKGTDYTKVQDASVKRALAIDANNKELTDSAVNELIGHLSAQNKEPYLAKARPLGEFVNAKDLFDYKRNNYTTTKNTTNKFDSNVQNLQRELNEKGYTDKFGNPLKEDGIMAGKTAYAYDTYVADNPQPQSQRFGNRATIPSRGADNRGKNEDKAKVTEVKETKSKGILISEDETRNKLKKTMINRLNENWLKNDGNPENQKKIENQVIKLRNFNDNSFNRALYLNDSTGASGFGHSAIMLMNKDNCSIIFSFYPDNEDWKNAALGNGEIRFTVLTPNQTNRVLYGDGYVFSMASSDGSIKTEQYDRFVYFDIDNGQGYNMYNEAVKLYEDPGFYSVLLRQCDDVATQIFRSGGFKMYTELFPNLTYGREKLKEIIKNAINTIH